MITKTRHIPATNDPEELRRSFNRVWDKINQVEQEQSNTITQVRTSVATATASFQSSFTTTLVTRFEVENSGGTITFDQFGHAALVPYTLKVLA